MCEPDGGSFNRRFGRESLGDEPDEPHPQPAPAAGARTGRRDPRA